jgi:hypothetical protein
MPSSKKASDFVTGQGRAPVNSVPPSSLQNTNLLQQPSDVTAIHTDVASEINVVTAATGQFNSDDIALAESASLSYGKRKFTGAQLGNLDPMGLTSALGIAPQEFWVGDDVETSIGSTNPTVVMRRSTVSWLTNGTPLATQDWVDGLPVLGMTTDDRLYTTDATLLDPHEVAPNGTTFNLLLAVRFLSSGTGFERTIWCTQNDASDTISRKRLYLDASGTLIYESVDSAGVLRDNISLSPDMPMNTEIIIAVSCSAGENIRVVYATRDVDSNGLTNTALSGSGTIGALTRMSVGGQTVAGVVGKPMRGYLRAFAYWPSFGGNLTRLIRLVRAAKYFAPVEPTTITNTQVFTATGNYVLPTGNILHQYVFLKGQGGGGGGGASGAMPVINSSSHAGGGGGEGGGAGKEKEFFFYPGSLIPNGATVTLTTNANAGGGVGADNISGASHGNSGFDGTIGGSTTLSFSNFLLTALGGALGTRGDASGDATNQHQGGAGGDSNPGGGVDWAGTGGAGGSNGSAAANGVDGGSGIAAINNGWVPAAVGGIGGLGGVATSIDGGGGGGRGGNGQPGLGTAPAGTAGTAGSAGGQGGLGGLAVPGYGAGGAGGGGGGGGGGHATPASGGIGGASGAGSAGNPGLGVIITTYVP